MKKKLQLLMGQLLLVGLALSLILTIFGGAFYLFLHGGEISSHQIFKQAPLSVAKKHWHELFTFSSYSIIQIGIIILVLTQLLRVSLLVVYYLKLHDLKFVGMSLFILGILIYSVFWYSNG